MHLQFPSFLSWLHSLLTACQGESGRHTPIFLSLFSLLLPFLVIPVSCVNKLIPSLGGFLVFCLYAPNLITLVFFFIACVSYWDSWKYVLTHTIKGNLLKDISTRSGPRFTRRKDISFENPSIGNNHNQSIAFSQSWLSENTLLNRNYDSH